MSLKLTLALLLLVLAAFSTEIYPNEGNVKIFRSEANEISWEDPQNLVPKEIKKQIASCLPPDGTIKSSNALFQSLSNWSRDIRTEALPILKELMFAMSQHVDFTVREEKTPNRTPLMLAAYLGMEKAVQNLLERNAPTEEVSHGKHTALHWAAKSSHSYHDSRACRILVQNGAKINSRTEEFGMTPLMYAAMQGHVGAAVVLLECGADSELKTTENDQVKKWKKNQHLTNLPQDKTALELAENLCNEKIHEEKKSLKEAMLEVFEVNRLKVFEVNRLKVFEVNRKIRVFKKIAALQCLKFLKRVEENGQYFKD